jgi:hypothetical protein
MSDAPYPAKPAQVDPSSEFAERRQRNLRELVEIGMVVARGLQRRAMGLGAAGGPPPGPELDDLAMSYICISREVRELLKLAAELDEQRQAQIRDDEVERRAEQLIVEALKDPPQFRKLLPPLPPLPPRRNLN